MAGMPGAGKGIVSDVARELGIRVYVMGDVVREEVELRGLEVSAYTMNMVAEDLRRIYGPEAVALKLCEKISRECSIRELNELLIDGVRSLDEIEYFRKYFNCEIITISVHASPKTRFNRVLARRRPGDPISWEEFVNRDSKELSFGLGNVIALSDYMIVNEGSIEETREEAKRILRRIIEND